MHWPFYFLFFSFRIKYLVERISSERGRTLYSHLDCDWHKLYCTLRWKQCARSRLDLSLEIWTFSSSCSSFLLEIKSIVLFPMETNTFSLDEIRRELTRLGYDGLSKQTLIKFQEDLEQLAQNERAPSKKKEKEFLHSFFFLDAHPPKRSVNLQQQSNVDFQVKVI